MSLYPFADTMTETVCDRFVRAARIRRPLRRLAWRNAVQDAINNLSSGVESRHAGINPRNAKRHIDQDEGKISSVWGKPPVSPLAEISGLLEPRQTERRIAGVAPGLLNNFRPAVLAKEDAALCVGSTSSIHAQVERDGGANSASPSGDSVRGNATA